MKKLLLLKILFSIFTFAQGKFQGWWHNPEQENYITIIEETDFGVISVVNFDPFEDHYIQEQIVKRSKKTFTTHIHRPENGWTVTIEYKLKSKNRLICKFTGDYNETLIYKRYKFPKQKLKT